MQQRKHRTARCTHAEPAAPRRRKAVTEHISSHEEIPDRRARRPVRKRPTNMRVLVIYRTGFVRSGVVSLIAKSMGFAVSGKTDDSLSETTHSLSRSPGRGRGSHRDSTAHLCSMGSSPSRAEIKQELRSHEAM